VIGSIPPPAPDLSQPPPTIQPATIVSFHNHNHKQNAVVTTTASTKAATLPKGQGQKGQVGTKAVGFEMTPATVNGLPPGTAAVDVATPKAVGNPNQPVTTGNVTKEKTPKCLINELARHNKISLEYVRVDESGPAHKKSFVVKLKLGEGVEEYTASGPSIKKAHHAAAAIALEKTGLQHPPAKTKTTKIPVVTPTVELNALAMKRGEPTVYSFLNPASAKPDGSSTSDQANKKEAPPPASTSTIATTPPTTKSSSTKQLTNGNSGNSSLKSRHSSTVTSSSSRGPPSSSAPAAAGKSGNGKCVHAYTVSLKVGQRQFLGEGHTQQAAKHNAASKALAVLKAADPASAPAAPLILPVASTATPPGGVKSNLNPASVPFIPASMKHAPAAPANKPSTTVQQVTMSVACSTAELDTEIKSPISLVHECALKRNLTVSFEIVKEVGPPHMRTFVMKCLMGDVYTQGEGNGKRAAKKKAAESMIEMLKTLPPVASCQVPGSGSGSSKKKSASSESAKNKQKAKVKIETLANPDYGQSINPISRLIQIQQAKKEKEPVYTLIEERGMPRRREFVMKVTINGHTTQGRGPNKKLAKRVAAESLLRDLGYYKPAPLPGRPALKSPPEQNYPASSAATATTAPSSTAAAPTLPLTEESVAALPAASAAPVVAENAKTAEKTKKLTFVGDVIGSTNSSSYKESEGTTSTNSSTKLVPIKQQNGIPSLRKVKMTPPGGHSLQKSNTVNSYSNNNPKQHHSKSNKVVMVNGTAGEESCTSSVQNKKMIKAVKSSPAKQELDALAKVLEFQVSYKTFPTKATSSDVVTLVTLKTNPPKFCHGSGKTVEESQNDAASHALLLIAGSPDTVNPIDGQSSAGSPVPVSDDVIVLAELPEKKQQTGKRDHRRVGGSR